MPDPDFEVAPHPDRGVYARLEVSLRNDGTWLCFIGNAWGTRGTQEIVQPKDFDSWLRDAIVKIKNLEEN